MGAFVEGELHLVMDAMFPSPLISIYSFYFLFLFIFLSSCCKERVDGHHPGLVTN
jgi:hypothetical protein